MNQYEVPAYLEDSVPDLRKRLRQLPSAFQLFDTITCFTRFTHAQLLSHNYTVAAHCLKAAGRLYSRGNKFVQQAIVGIFISDLAHLPVQDNRERIALCNLIPENIYPLYIQEQLNITHHGN